LLVAEAGGGELGDLQFLRREHIAVSLEGAPGCPQLAGGPDGPRLGAQAFEYLQRGGELGPRLGRGPGAAQPSDFAAATRDVLYGMTIIMAVAFVVALRGLTRGVQQETETSADANDALRAAR
jgi:hypothetical protein